MKRQEIKKGYVIMALKLVKPFKAKIIIILLLTSLVAAVSVAEPETDGETDR